jgi:hypothetical protein
MKRLIPIALCLLAGCNSISNSKNPIQDIISALPTPIKDSVTTDLVDAAYNLDQAQALGILPASDFAPTCAHMTNQLLGIEPGPPGSPAIRSFEPKVGGTTIASGGSKVYIEAQKLAAVQRDGIPVPQACVLLLGQFNLQQLNVLFRGAGAVPFRIVPTPPLLMAPAARPAP